MEPWFAQIIVLLSLFTPLLIYRGGPVAWLPAFIINMLALYASMYLQGTTVELAGVWRAMTYIEIVILALNVSLSIMRALELFRARERERYERIIQPP